MLTDQLERRRAASSYEQNSGGGDLSPRLRVIHANSNGRCDSFAYLFTLIIIIL